MNGRWKKRHEDDERAKLYGCAPSLHVSLSLSLSLLYSSQSQPLALRMQFTSDMTSVTFTVPSRFKSLVSSCSGEKLPSPSRM